MEEQKMIFNLSSPIEYTRKGEFEKAYSLEIEPPSPKDYGFVIVLAQRVTKAMFEAQRMFSGMAVEGDQEQAGEMDADAVKMMLLSSTISIEEFIIPFVKLLEQACTLDGETKLKASIIEKIGIVDRTQILCEYIVNFIVPLVLPPASREA